ncbi:MAG: type II and III secretion system protein family protein [Sneathiellales bacterium]|nr:type II and III secretion system protein family protein [Sneathiellales bacterium]
MKKYIGALVATGLIFLSTLFISQTANAAKVIGDVGDTLSLTLNSGKLIRLDKPATSVFVGNSELADVQVQSPKIIYVFAKKPGKTNLFALDSRGQVLVNSPVIIQHDVSALQAALSDLTPNSKIYAKSMNGGIILTGKVESPAISESAHRLASLYSKVVFNRLTVEGNVQVNLRVQVAEVARSVTKQLGVNWEQFSSLGNFAFGVGTGRDVVDGATSSVLRNGTLSSAFLGFNDGQTSINSLIDALEEEGLITLLAEPNLTALSGESASFLAGGEFPIPVPGEDGTVTVDYKEFGVSLDFTPNLVGNNRINLKVSPEVSQLSSTSAINIGGIFIQSLITRRADTTVELASGQSFVLGGLLNSDSDNSISKTPLLGELPIIGALFRSSSFQRNETELVIIVTPYIVKPSNSRMALPTDGYIPPNDKDLYRDGRNFRPTYEDEEAKAPTSEKSTANKEVKLVGPAGFIME